MNVSLTQNGKINLVYDKTGSFLPLTTTSLENISETQAKEGDERKDV